MERPLGRSLIAAACLLSVSMVRAVDYTFDPEAEVRVLQNGNVNVTGSGRSDQAAQFSLVLPWTAKTPRTSFRVVYRPHYQRYGEVNGASHLAHHLTAGMQRSLSRRSNFGLSFYGSRGEQQSQVFEAPELVSSLVPRTTVTRGGFDVNGRLSTGERTFLTWGVGGGINRYEDPVIVTAIQPSTGQIVTGPLPLVDSDYVEGRFGWGMEFSERTTAGIEYSGRFLTFEDIPITPPFREVAFTGRQTTAHSIYFNGSRKFGATVTGNLQLGVVRTQVEGSTVAGGARANIDPSVNASFARSITQNASLAFGVRQSVGSGNGLSGASLDRGGFGSWAWASPRTGFGAGVTLAYWQREAIEEATLDRRSATRTLQMSENLSWTPGSHFSYGVFHSYRDQAASDGSSLGFGPDSQLEANGYHSGGLFVRWNIFGRLHRAGDRLTG